MDEHAEKIALEYHNQIIFKDPGNVFTERIVNVVRGQGTDIVTIRLDPSEPIELTVAFTPVPPRGLVAPGISPLEEGVDIVTGPHGEPVKVYVPVPMGFVVKGN